MGKVDLQREMPFGAGRRGEIALASSCRAIITLVLCCVSLVSGAANRALAEDDPLAIVEQATYSARLSGDELTAGEASLLVRRHGAGTGVLDWSDVRLAMSSLQWANQSLISGSTDDQRLLVLTHQDVDELQGRWSLRGQRIGETIHFDAVFPPALATTVRIQAPVGFMLSATRGLLTRQALSDDQTIQHWTLELGRSNAVTLRASPASAGTRTVQPRYEIDSTLVARRDGLFVQTNLAVDMPVLNPRELQLEVSENLELQAVSVSGVTLPFRRLGPTLVEVPLAELALESRFTIRIRAFQPVKWGERRVLPVVQAPQWQQMRCSVTVRVEPPLQMRSVDALGMLQTALSSDDARGEVWRFEAERSQGSIHVLIDEPSTELSVDLSCLLDNRQTPAWAAAVALLRVKEGTHFATQIQLPQDWQVVSVRGDQEPDARIASWNVQDNLLRVNWQNPLTSASARRLRVFAYCDSLREGQPALIEAPIVQNARDVNVQYQILLPAGANFDLLNDGGWRQADQTSLNPAFHLLPEAASRLGGAEPTARTLQATNGASGRIVWTLPRVEPSPLQPIEAGSDESLTDDPARLSAKVTLKSMTGRSSVQERIHDVLFEFSEPVSIAALKMVLPLDFPVSAVAVDDQSITVFREGPSIRLPADVVRCRKLRVTYLASGESRFLYSINETPVPKLNVPISEFLWVLELAGDDHLASIELPGVIGRLDYQNQRQRRLSGPLAREPGESIFDPLSWRSWVSAAYPRSRVADMGESRRTIEFRAPSVGSSVVFITWNSSQSRSYGWIALLGSLLLGCLGRRFANTSGRRVRLIWVAALLIALAVVPVAWSVIVGGLLVGTLFSMLIPQRLVVAKDLLARRASSGSLRTAATAAILLGLTTTAPGQATPSGSSRNGLDWRASASSLTSLIQSARYRLLETSPTPRIKAEFSVLVQPSAQQSYLKIPFENVVFPNETSCEVDGVRCSLLPSAAGDAILVPIEADGSEASGDGQLPGGWRRHQVSIEFVVRTGVAMGRMDDWKAIVPKVIDSSLHLPEEVNADRFLRWGGMERDSRGGNLLSLGPSGVLAETSAHPGPEAAARVSAVTLLDMTSLILRGQTQLTCEQGELPEILNLYLPAGAVVTTLAGPDVIDWMVSPDSSVETEVTVRLRPNSGAGISAAFELPRPESPQSTWVLPEFDFVRGSLVSHSIGITKPPATSLEILSGEALAIPPEQWRFPGEGTRIRPALAFQLTSPQSVSLRATTLAPVRSATVSESVLVRSNALDWTALVALYVEQVPAFVHQLRIRPGMHVESVLAGSDGSEEPVRFAQDGDRLSLFVSGGQSGARTFRVTGTSPFTTDVWSAIPTLDPIDATLRESDFSVWDETGWMVELETAIGTKIQTSAVAENTSAAAGQGHHRHRLVAFRKGLMARPARIRAQLPPEAIHADSAVLLNSPPTGDWEIGMAFRFSSDGPPLRKATFQIPREYHSPRIRPSHLRHTLEQNESGTALTVWLPSPRPATPFVLTISAKISEETRRELTGESPESESAINLPLPRATSATPGTRTLIYNPESHVVPVSSTSESDESSPIDPWCPKELQPALAEGKLVAVALSGPELRLTRAGASEGASPAEIFLEETVVWPLADNRMMSESRLWVSVNGAKYFVATPAPGTVIEQISPVSTLPLDRGRFLMEFPADTKLVEIVIRYSSSNENHAVEMLDYGDQRPIKRLVSIVKPVVHGLSSEAEPLNVLTVWLSRWESLRALQLRANPTGAARDSLLAAQQVCRRNVEALLQSATFVPADVQTLFNRLISESRADLEAVATSENEVTDPFAETLEEAQAGLSVLLISPETAKVDVGRFGDAPPPYHLAWLIVGTLTLLIAALWYGQRLADLRDRLFENPAWGLLLLGLIWWQFLSPSIVGFLIMIGSAGLGWLLRKPVGPMESAGASSSQT